MQIKNLFVVFIMLVIYTTSTVMALNPNTTDTPVATVTQTAAQSIVTQPVSTTKVLAEGIQGANQTPVATAIVTGTVVSEGPGPRREFRVGPTVKIRPLNDIINKSADGLIELYMDNPSLNDATLTVDARISVPAGIHVYGQGFGEAAAAGTVYGVFDVPPGKARTIYITIKAEKTGDFITQFSGTYYPDGNKDAYQPISLTHPFKVYEASPNPQSDAPTSPQSGGQKVPGISAFSSILIIVVTVLIIKWRSQNR